MRSRDRVLIGAVGVLAGWVSLAPVVDAQPPLRIGASISRTGTYAEMGPMIHRGYQLCVKHTNHKGGLLGRKVDLVVDDDQSDPVTAVRIYERLITKEKVEAILGAYSSPIADAVAEISEKHRMPMISTGAAVVSIFRKKRRFLFMSISRAEAYLEGPIDMAAKRGLRTVGVIHEDTLFPIAVAQGAIEWSRRRGLQVVVVGAYPRGTSDFSGILGRVRAANPDLLAAATYFDDAVAITRQLRELDVNPRMFAVTVGGEFPKFYETLGRTAEYVYTPAQWAQELVTLRAGGLVPIARQYPGAREFVEAYKKDFPGADLPYQVAQGYGACEVLVAAIGRAGSLDGEKVRAALLTMDLNTAFGAFKVDRDGVQTAHKMVMIQWQEGRKVIVWPEELAPGKPRFPTPPWSQR